MGCCQSGMNYHGKNEIQFKCKQDDQTPEIYQVPGSPFGEQFFSQNFSDWQNEQQENIYYPSVDYLKHYKVLKKLNDNRKKIVYKVLDTRTKEKKVAKVYNRNFFGKTKTKQLIKKFKLASKLNHPNIIQPQAVYQTEKELVVIQRYCKGQTLQDYITGCFELNEMQILRSFLHVLNAVRYCHDKKVAHMNINPLNLMFVESIPDSGLALINFSKCKSIQQYDNRRISDMQYRIYSDSNLARKQLEKMDIWSSGMILFVMLVGYTNVERNPTVLWDLLNQDERFSSDTCLGYDLAKKMLELDQSQRLESAQILEHPWVQSILSFDFDIMLKQKRLKGAVQATKRYIALGQNCRKSIAKLQGYFERDNSVERGKIEKCIKIVYDKVNADFTEELEQVFRNDTQASKQEVFQAIELKQWHWINDIYERSIESIYPEKLNYKTIILCILSEGIKPKETFLYTQLISLQRLLELHEFVEMVKSNFIV